MTCDFDSSSSLYRIVESSVGLEGGNDSVSASSGLRILSLRPSTHGLTSGFTIARGATLNFTLLDSISGSEYRYRLFDLKGKKDENGNWKYKPGARLELLNRRGDVLDRQWFFRDGEPDKVDKREGVFLKWWDRRQETVLFR